MTFRARKQRTCTGQCHGGGHPERTYATAVTLSASSSSTPWASAGMHKDTTKEKTTAVSTAISMFDTQPQGSDGSVGSGARGRSWIQQRHGKYLHGNALAEHDTRDVAANFGVQRNIQEVNMYSFRAPSDTDPQRRFLMTERGSHNVDAVFQLEHDDPLQQSESRSAYCRSAVVTHQKLLSHSSSASKGEDMTKVGHTVRGEEGRNRYMGCDTAAASAAELEAAWLRDFTPYARPYAVEPCKGRCGQVQHYSTTFERVQPVTDSAMYLNEDQRLCRRPM